MIGAILGDIVGSRYEFSPIKTKAFPLFGPGCTFTDDTAMTVAVARGLLAARGDRERLPAAFAAALRQVGRAYPDVGYGRRFTQWLASDAPAPYHSFGNGSAMRVSPCGFAARSLEEAMDLAACSAAVTHDHPEGIRGAKAVAACIYLARTGRSKADIRAHVERHFYPLRESLEELRPGYSFQIGCRESVPQAIECFLEAADVEDAIRNAVSLGGDSDTQACIAGGIAEAFFGVPEALRRRAETYLPEEFLTTLADFSREMVGRI